MIQFSKMARRMAVVLGLVAASSGAWAQSSATGTANVTANVIRPITITAVNALAFGNVVPIAGGGTLLVSAAASPTVTPSDPLLQPGSTQQGTISAASFTVAGEGTLTYSVTLPTTATINGPSSAHMTVGSFTSGVGAGPSGTLGGTTGNAGSQTLYVGATLTVGATQAPGSYTGTFDVTVAYN